MRYPAHPKRPRPLTGAELEEQHRREVRAVLDGERDEAACVLSDASGDRVCHVHARRVFNGQELKLSGYVRLANALNALEAWSGRAIAEVCEIDGLAPWLAACVVRLERGNT